MLGGFAGILLIEILSKVVDLYSVLKGDWDLALRPKATSSEAKLLIGAVNSKAKKQNKEGFSFPHDGIRFNGSALSILGFKSKSNPTLSEVKAAYRKMIGIYHPDLYTVYDKTIQAEATRRAQIINASYHKLRERY